MNKEKGETEGHASNCRQKTGGKITRESRKFPVIDISRSELEMFLGEESTASLTDDDIALFADKLGDRLIDYFADELFGLYEELFDVD